MANEPMRWSDVPVLGQTASAAAAKPGNVSPEEEFASRFYEPAAPVPDELYPVEAVTNRQIVQHLDELGNRIGLSSAQREAERVDYFAVMRESGLHADPPLVELLHERLTRARMRDALRTVDDAAAARADPDRVLTNEQIWTAQREKRGAHDAEDLEQRTVKYLSDHPKLKALVEAGDLGSDADVVDALFEFVRRNVR